MPMYVPRDEALGESKRKAFNLGKLKGVLHNIIPSLVTNVIDKDALEGFSEIEDLYKERSLFQMKSRGGTSITFPLSRELGIVRDSIQSFLKFDPPKIISGKYFPHLNYTSQAFLT